jgi:hypothetical protein
LTVLWSVRMRKRLPIRTAASRPSRIQLRIDCPDELSASAAWVTVKRSESAIAASRMPKTQNGLRPDPQRVPDPPTKHHQGHSTTSTTPPAGLEPATHGSGPDRSSGLWRSSRCDDRDDADVRITIVDSTPFTAQERRRAERGAPPRSDDDRSVLAGMKRPATPSELRAFVDREQARIRAERGLPPAT